VGSALPPLLVPLEPYLADLPMLCIVSEVELRPLPDASGADGEDDGMQITIERTSGVKCERCWRYVLSLSSEPDSAGLCDRCLEALHLTRLAGLEVGSEPGV
jgi:isoleucyl-tRNA synthetase